MNELTAAIDSFIHRVGEMTEADLNSAVAALERGLIHVIVEQHLRQIKGVSHLQPVPDSSH